MSEVRIRPMAHDDLIAAAAVLAATYGAVWTPEQAVRWSERTAHLVGTDPGGCWVAERGVELVGFAVSSKRELMWLLASYAVLPGLQGHGIGTALFAVAEGYGRGCLHQAGYLGLRRMKPPTPYLHHGALL